jgi:hypothetical protein
MAVWGFRVILVMVRPSGLLCQLKQLPEGEGRFLSSRGKIAVRIRQLNTGCLPVEHRHDKTIAKRVGGEWRDIFSATASPDMLEHGVCAEGPSGNLEEDRIRSSIRSTSFAWPGLWHASRISLHYFTCFLLQHVRA